MGRRSHRQAHGRAGSRQAMLSHRHALTGYRGAHDHGGGYSHGVHDHGGGHNHGVHDHGGGHNHGVHDHGVHGHGVYGAHGHGHGHDHGWHDHGGAQVSTAAHMVGPWLGDRYDHDQRHNNHDDGPQARAQTRHALSAILSQPCSQGDALTDACL